MKKPSRSKKTVNKVKKSRNRNLTKAFRFLGFLFFLGFVYAFLQYQSSFKSNYTDAYISDSLHITPWEKTKLDRTLKNYKKSILLECKEEYLSPSYFLALATLESSGKKNPKKRFEKKVYYHLKGVRDKKYKSFGSIKRKKLRGLSDAAIKNLATSWGPFQLMGYQAFELGVYVSDIRGKASVKYGIKWCNNRYGKYLQKKEYYHCFHIHNTGKPHPKFGKPFTHDPEYISKGLKYMAYFDLKLKQ